jgi:hypothetical protein
MLDAFLLKILFYLKVLELRSIIALFSPLAQIHFELFLGSALKFLGFQFYPAKEHPSEAGKVVNNYKTILTSPDAKISNMPKEIHM